MLELLATNTIYDAADPGSPIETLNDTAGDDQSFYDDSLGWCTYSQSLGGYCIVQLDGAAYLRGSQGRANEFTLDMQRAGEYLINDSLSEDAIYLFDKRSGTRGELIYSGASTSVTDLLVRAADRYLSTLGTSVRFKPLELPGSWTNEATLTYGGGTTSWSRTRAQNVLALINHAGEIVYYDVEARAQVGGVSYIGTNQGAWYSPKHDIFVARASPHVLKVYANAVRPDSLSNPAAVSPLTQGRVSQVRVRLLGSNSDPCEGELIDWSITAGVGALAEAQSTTDEDGYAYNDYIAPVVASGSPAGNVTIQAQALF